MPGRIISQVLSKELPISFTDKPVTAFGGLAVFARFCRRIGLSDVLRQAVPDERTSPNAIDPVEIALAFLVGVLRGAGRFAHVSWLRLDEPLQRLFCFLRPPSASTVTRFFGAFRRKHVEHLWPTLSRFVTKYLPRQPWGHTLDLDSTVFVRYGNQEGSLKGYNPKKPGRPSHHPLLAFLAEAKMVLHVWLRSGNSGTAQGVVAFLKEALALLPEGHTIYAVRADSGFCNNAFLSFLEAEGFAYAVAARFTKKVQRIVAYQVSEWRNFGPGLEVGETTYLALGWEHPRRMVIVREKIIERPAARGRKLIDVPGYTFHALVTSLDWPAEQVWRFYNGRADSENRIKELAKDYHAKCFCVRRFYGTEAALRMVCFLFNLVAIFKRTVLKDTKPMLERLRISLFAAGAILGMEKGKSILRIGLRGKFKHRLKQLLERLERQFPTASQLVQKEDIP